MNHSARRINVLANALNARTYLEIGVEDGKTFVDVEIEYRTAVDPRFRFDTSALENEKTRFFAQESDKFFLESPVDMTFDIIFIDGLHTFEQVVRDFSNAILCSTAKTVILLDDTKPNDVFSSLNKVSDTMKFRRAAGLDGGAWHGDVFKAVYYIHDFWPGLRYATIVGRDNPQTLVWRSNKLARTPLLNNLEVISRMSYFDLMRTEEIMRQCSEGEALELCLADLRG